MRITFVLPVVNSSGGIRVIATHAAWLRKRGHHVRLVSPPPPSPSLRDRARALVREHRLLPLRPQASTHLMDGLADLHRVIDRYRPIVDADLPEADVVIATWWETAEWVARLSPAKGRKAYFVQGHELFEHLPHERVRATYRSPLRKIAVAQWLVDVMRDRYGDPSSILVPNAVDHAVFDAPARDKQPVPTVGVMYSDVHCKGCDIALRAVAIARQTVPNLKLRSFGHRLSPRLPLPADTDFTLEPTAAELRRAYATCDAWLFSAREEGFGLPILEAMACHTPVIGTPAAAAPEILAGGAGVLVPPEDAEAMARAIVDVCRMDNASWRQLAEVAYTRAGQYSWEPISTRFEAALVEIARG
jgi:glycosyltransferase involved in cell wall biosynthesis